MDIPTTLEDLVWKPTRTVSARPCRHLFLSDLDTWLSDSFCTHVTLSHVLLSLCGFGSRIAPMTEWVCLWKPFWVPGGEKRMGPGGRRPRQRPTKTSHASRKPLVIVEKWKFPDHDALPKNFDQQNTGIFLVVERVSWNADSTSTQTLVAKSGSRRALMRSLPSVAFTIFPTSPPSPLLVCTCLPVWPSTRCHWPHLSASATSGVLVEEGFHARVCREAGARVRTNVMVRDFVPLAAGQRRLEVGAHGLSLHGGPHLCHHWLETVQSSGVPTARTQFSWTRRRKERTNPELAGVGGTSDVHLQFLGGVLHHHFQQLRTHGHQVCCTICSRVSHLGASNFTHDCRSNSIRCVQVQPLEVCCITISLSRFSPWCRNSAPMASQDI